MTTPCWEASADLVVVGTGVAGLTAALRARELGLDVLVVTKENADGGNTRWAQGGVAVVLGDVESDSIARHVDDTLVAGVGLCDVTATSRIIGTLRCRRRSRSSQSAHSNARSRPFLSVKTKA